MSTAEPMLEEASGYYYSILRQGAGLAAVDQAIGAASYILVDGQPDGKVKAELKDDPDRTGVYAFSFTLHDLRGQDTPYTLSADLFTQGVFEDYIDKDQTELGALYGHPHRGHGRSDHLPGRREGSYPGPGPVPL